jgi:hypothetical protein
VVDHQLVAHERVAPAHRESTCRDDLAAHVLRHFRREAHDDLAIDDAQRAALLVAEGHWRRPLRRLRRARLAGAPAEREDSARCAGHERSGAHRVAMEIGRHLDP